jgi:hypothetical protein
MYITRGVIREVAQQMCGGNDKLSAALTRRAVVELTADDVTLYYFPKNMFGKYDDYHTARSIARQEHDDRCCGCNLWILSEERLGHQDVTEAT